MSGAGLVKMGTAGFVVWFGFQYAGVLVQTKNSVEKSAAGVDLYSVDKFLQQYGALPDHAIEFPPVDQAAFQAVLAQMVEVHGERQAHQDQWGQPYRYTRLGMEDYDIGSNGKDGVSGTADDLLLTRRGAVVKLNIDLQKVTSELVDQEVARKEKQAADATEFLQSVAEPPPTEPPSSVKAAPEQGDGVTPSAKQGVAPAQPVSPPQPTPGTGQAEPVWTDNGPAPSGKPGDTGPTASEQRKANLLLGKAKALIASKKLAAGRQMLRGIVTLYPNTRAAKEAAKALSGLGKNGP